MQQRAPPCALATLGCWIRGRIMCIMGRTRPELFLGFLVLSPALADVVSVIRVWLHHVRIRYPLCPGLTSQALMDGYHKARTQNGMDNATAPKYFLSFFRSCSTRRKQTPVVFFVAFSVVPYAKNETHSSNPAPSATQQTAAKLFAWRRMWENCSFICLFCCFFRYSALPSSFADPKATAARSLRRQSDLPSDSNTAPLSAASE